MVRMPLTMRCTSGGHRWVDYGRKMPELSLMIHSQQQAETFRCLYWRMTSLGSLLGDNIGALVYIPNAVVSRLGICACGLCGWHQMPLLKNFVTDKGREAVSGHAV